MDRVRGEVADEAGRGAGTVFAFAASMMTNVIVHDLFPQFGTRHWMLDFGSVLDVYAGVQSRSVYRDLDWSKAIAGTSETDARACSTRFHPLTSF